MNNEEKILTILQQIQNDITELKEGQSRIESIVSDLEPKNAVRHLELNTNIEEMHKDIKFIKHKLHINEEEIFDIKDKLKLVK